MAYLTAPYFIESLESRAEQFLLFFLVIYRHLVLFNFTGFELLTDPRLSAFYRKLMWRLIRMRRRSEIVVHNMQYSRSQRSDLSVLSR